MLVLISFLSTNLCHPQNIDSYYCTKENCLRSFSLKNSYRKHLLNHIEMVEIIEPTFDMIEQPSTSQQHNDDISFNSVISTTVVKYGNSIKEPIEILNKSISNFLEFFYANPIIPKNAVQAVVINWIRLLQRI